MKRSKKNGKLVLLAACFLALVLASCETKDMETAEQSEEIISEVIQEEAETDISQEKEAAELGSETIDRIGQSYIIMEIDSEEKTIRFYNTGLERLQIFEYDDGTYYYNSFDGLMSLDQFEAGDIVDVELESGSYTLRSMKESGESWELEEVSDYRIDTSVEGQHYIQIDRKKYRLADFLAIFRDGQQSSINSLKEEDVLRVKGIGNCAEVLVVTQSTGYIQLAQTEHYLGGYYTVGNFKSGEIAEEGQMIPVKEGRHLFSVANNGYGGSEEVEVKAGEITQVELTQIDTEGSHTCNLSVDITPSWGELYIDGKKTETAESFPVGYGSHTMTIIAAGYDNYTRILLVNSPQAKLTFDVTGGVAEDSEDDLSGVANAGSKQNEDGTASTDVTDGNTANSDAGDSGTTRSNSNSGTSSSSQSNSGTTGSGSSNNSSASSNGSSTSGGIGSHLSSDENSNSTSGNTGSSLSASDLISTLTGALGSGSSSSNTSNNILNSLIN